MPNINYEAELANALLTQIQLERQLRLMTDSYDKLSIETQQLRDKYETYDSQIRVKEQTIERLHRENSGLNSSNAGFRNVLRGFREQPRLLHMFRERMKLIHDLSRPFENEQVSEASGESNESNLVSQGIPAGGEIRHDREASPTRDSQDARTTCESAVGQGSALTYYKCKECGADRR